MSCKFFFIGCGYEVFADLARHFISKHNWELLCWTAFPSSEERVRQDFPQTIFHCTLDHIKKLMAKAKDYEVAAGWKSKLAYVKQPWRWLDVAKNAYSYVTSEAPPNYIKKRGVSIEKSFMTGFEWRRDRARRKAIHQKLNQFYVSRSETAPLDVPYVYLALHFQPERTTSPLGGVFVDQLLIVDLLRASLPEDWFLYVKEAPSHFWPNVAKQVCRSEDFYEYILTKPNTKLLSMDMDPFMLLDKAKAVATITGTSAWEAVIRGVPAMVFGYAWYRGCEGVYTIDNGEDVQAAVNAIENGFKPDRNKVRLFNKVLEDMGSRAFVEPRYKELVNVSEETNIKLLSKAILAKVNGGQQPGLNQSSKD